MAFVPNCAGASVQRYTMTKRFKIPLYLPRLKRKLLSSFIIAIVLVGCASKYLNDLC